MSLVMCGDSPADYELDTQENGISDSLGTIGSQDTNPNQRRPCHRQTQSADVRNWGVGGGGGG